MIDTQQHGLLPFGCDDGATVAGGVKEKLLPNTPFQRPLLTCHLLCFDKYHVDHHHQSVGSTNMLKFSIDVIICKYS